MSSTQLHSPSRGANGRGIAGSDIALRRAEAARREHRSGHDGDWPTWYAAYLVAEQAGTDLPA